MRRERKRPAPPQNRPLRNNTNANDSSVLHRRQDGYAAPDADDRADAAVLAAAAERGYRLAVQCSECRRWLAAHDSVRLHLGPVCRKRVGSVVA